MRQRKVCDDTLLYRKIKILVLGAGKTGKTSLIKRLLSMDFEDKYKPTVYDVFTHPIDYDKGRFLFQFTDFAGEYSFPPMRRLSITNNDIFVLVHDVMDKKSLTEVERLRKEITELKGKEYCRKFVIVVGNKTDCMSKTDLHHLSESMINNIGSSLITSARTGYNVERLSRAIAEESETFVLSNRKIEKIN